MRVLVHILDRYGDKPAQSAMVFLNDGPSSFKGQDGKVDMELVNHCLSEAFPKEFNDTPPVEEWLDSDNINMDAKGISVHIVMEEQDFLVTNVEPLLED